MCAVSGVFSLAINNGSGTIDLSTVGTSSSKLTTFTLYGTGNNKLNGDIVTTGAIDLKGTSRTTQLFSDVTINTTNSDVTAGTINGGTTDGSFAFNVNNGTGTIVAGNVGLNVKLKSLTFAGTGNTNIGTVETTNGYDLKILSTCGVCGWVRVGKEFYNDWQAISL